MNEKRLSAGKKGDFCYECPVFMSRVRQISPVTLPISSEVPVDECVKAGVALILDPGELTSGWSFAGSIASGSILHRRSTSYTFLVFCQGLPKDFSKKPQHRARAIPLTARLEANEFTSSSDLLEETKALSPVPEIETSENGSLTARFVSQDLQQQKYLLLDKMKKNKSVYMCTQWSPF